MQGFGVGLAGFRVSVFWGVGSGFKDLVMSV